jgi:hypothetical protein
LFGDIPAQTNKRQCVMIINGECYVIDHCGPPGSQATWSCTVRPFSEELDNPTGKPL